MEGNVWALTHGLTYGLKPRGKPNPDLTEEGSHDIYNLGVGGEGALLHSLKIRRVIIGMNWRCEETHHSLNIFPRIEPEFNYFFGGEDSVTIIDTDSGNKQVMVVTGCDTRVPKERCTRLSDSRVFRSVAWRILEETIGKDNRKNVILYCTGDALAALDIPREKIHSACLYKLTISTEEAVCYIYRGHLLNPPEVVKPACNIVVA